MFCQASEDVKCKSVATIVTNAPAHGVFGLERVDFPYLTDNKGVAVEPISHIGSSKKHLQVVMLQFLELFLWMKETCVQ